MSVQDLGDIGSFVGGLLGVVALLYLAYQIRQNTTALRMTAYQESLRFANEWSLLFATDTAAAQLLLRARADFAGLGELERTQVSEMLSTALRNYGFNRELQRNRLIPPGVAEAYEFGLRPFLDTPAGRAWWAANAVQFDEAFRAHVGALLERWERSPG